jgi:hypothetical protein
MIRPFCERDVHYFVKKRKNRFLLVQLFSVLIRSTIGACSRASKTITQMCASIDRKLIMPRVNKHAYVVRLPSTWLSPEMVAGAA